ncbi:MAG: hypothetical protein IIA05_04880 [Proteobacteria bacterium]|nr:hypothetical protein [Pseudomonadota bacterium]
MKTRYLLVALAAVAISGCATGASPGPAPVQTAQAAPTFTQDEIDQMSAEEKVAIYNSQQEEKNQIICRKTQVTGSHRKRTVCRTAELIRLEQEEARRTFENVQRGNAASVGGD